MNTIDTQPKDIQPNRANDEYDNTSVQISETIPNRQFPDDDPNEGDNPVDPDQGDTIPPNDDSVNDIGNDSGTDTGSDSSDVLNESIEDPSQIPSEDIDTSTNHIVSNEYDDAGNLPDISPDIDSLDIDPEQDVTSFNRGDASYNVNSTPEEYDLDQSGT